MAMTITEALAELKTLDRRLLKKRMFVGSYMLRPEKLKDPLAKQGGSEKVLAEERQSIADLENRIIDIRTAIQVANLNTVVEVQGITRSIARWLVYRRDVLPQQQAFLSDLKRQIDRQRQEGLRRGSALVSSGAASESGPEDIVVNLDEQELSAEIELLETIAGTLDGRLSLANATVTIEV